MDAPYAETELILNPDGSIYHLHLQPEQVADTVFTVGDPARVPLVSHHFDRIEHQVAHREFVTHTGYIGNQRLTVMSTGMGVGPMDIVINELDALVNIDFQSRRTKTHLRTLNIIRLGTAGALQTHLPLDSIVVSQGAAQFSGLMHHYNTNASPQDVALTQALQAHVAKLHPQVHVNVISADPTLLAKTKHLGQCGLTATCIGFYGPQGRGLRAPIRHNLWLEHLAEFKWQQHQILNFEMETAELFALGQLLGHRCLSVSTLLAQRQLKQFSSQPQQAVVQMIDQTLQAVLK